MRHTFLLEEGDWLVSGTYVDAGGAKQPVEGLTKVQHGPAAWVTEGQLEIKGGAGQTLQNHYDIAPMPEGSEVTTWSCEDPREGRIQGVIHVVDDCVISSFTSEATGYHGVDVLRKAKDEYRSRGFAMRGGDRLSSWMLTVKRAKRASAPARAKAARSAKPVKKEAKS